MEIDDIALNQRGRSAIDFANSLLERVIAAAPGISAKVEERFGDGSDLPADLDERAAMIEGFMLGDRGYRMQQMIGDWHARNHGPIAIEAFEEIEDRLQPALDKAERGPSTLHLDPDLAVPDYHSDVAFHRTAAWESHPHMGFIHSELVHKKMVARFAAGKIFEDRRKIAARAPRAEYKRILEMGASSGLFTIALAETYPEAEIIAVDLSARMLEHAWRTCNQLGHRVDFRQADSASTGLADRSVDLVASFIMLHEMPPEAIVDTFKEAYRVLEPGGDMIMSDVTRYADLGPIDEWRADRSARLGGEPHWRASASLDLAELASAAGFTNVTAGGVYPHVLQARKPA